MKTAFSRLQNQMHKRKMICKTFLGDHKGICLYCFRLCRKRRKAVTAEKAAPLHDYYGFCYQRLFIALL